MGEAANGVRRGDRTVLGVLVEIQKDSCAAFFLPPRSGDVLRRAAFDLTCKGKSSAAYLPEAEVRRDPDVDVNAAVAGSLRPSDRAEVIQHLAAPEGVDLEITVEITASKKDGFPDDKTRIVSENARTLKFDQFGFEDR